MIYAKVDETGQKQLKAEMKETKDKKWYQRLKIIDLSAQGYRVTVLSDLFDLSEHTIRTYIHNYNEDGLVGLTPNYGKGRPLLLDWTKNQWLDLLHQPPANHEQLKSGAINWTQELLQQYFALYHQLTISRSTLSKAIKRAGLRWRRAKLTIKSPDPL